MPNVIGIIPARYGSSRFPGKPLVDLCGKPMIQHVYERAIMAKTVQRVFIATDDIRIFNAAYDFGAGAIMTRPDHLSGTDRVAEAADLLMLGYDDIVVNIQGDQPVFDPGQIDEVVNALSSDSGAHIATLARKIDPTDVRKNDVTVVFDKLNHALYFSRQHIPHGPGQTFKHYGMYAFRRGCLGAFPNMPKGKLEFSESLEQLRALENGYKIRCAITSQEILEINAPGDVAAVIERLRDGR